MKKLIVTLTALLCALAAVPALADVAADPVTVVKDSMEEGGIWLAAGLLAVALAALIVIIIKRRKNK